MNDNLTVPDDVVSQFRKGWGWLLAFGILSILLGFVGLGSTFFLSVVSAIFFGVLLLVGGVAQIVSGFKSAGWKGKLWHFLVALLYLAAGGMLISNPVEGSILLTAVLGSMLLAIGLLRIFTAFSSREIAGWVWVLISGIVTLLLGALIIAQWPSSGLWVIGLFIAIELIISGWGYVALAIAARAGGK